MKRTFLFLAAFAVVATSCSKNTLVDTPSVAYDASKINFAPSTGLSKANDNGMTEVKAGFEVFALVGDGKDVDGKLNPDKMYFGKPTGTENNYTFGAAWAWGNDTGKDWPVDASKYPMTFLAMVPAQPKFAANYTGTIDWTELITQGTSTADTKDYLSATTIQPAAPLSGQLSSLKFKHIMSQINFSVTIPTGYTVYVTKAIYHNLHNVNTYNFLTQAWDSTKTTSAGTVAYIADNGAVQNFTGKAYVAPSAPAIAPNPAPAYASHAIAVTGGNSIKALPQYFAESWKLADFKTAAEAWTKIDKVTTPTPWPTKDATDALATGTYVELQYALVDANGVCLVGLINGQKQMIAGVPTEYKGEDQFLRVAYLVDLSKKDASNLPTSDLDPGKKYTYKIALGTPDATGGTVLDPNYIKADGTTPGDDSGKEPGDDVNEKATLIGFTVDVVEWTDAEGDFEPLP